MTPSVAFRCLYQELQHFQQQQSRGLALPLNKAFSGVIQPPVRHGHRPIGDPVVDAVAEYAARVVARAGLLGADHGHRDQYFLQRHGRLVREIFTIEHAVGTDLAKANSDLGFRQCDNAGRTILGLAAYWFHVTELQNDDGTSLADLLLGAEPEAAMSSVLWHHSRTALQQEGKASVAAPRSRTASSASNDFGLEQSLAPAS